MTTTKMTTTKVVEMETTKRRRRRRKWNETSDWTTKVGVGRQHCGVGRMRLCKCKQLVLVVVCTVLFLTTSAMAILELEELLLLSMMRGGGGGGGLDALGGARGMGCARVAGRLEKNGANNVGSKSKSRNPIFSAKLLQKLNEKLVEAKKQNQYERQRAQKQNGSSASAFDKCHIASASPQSRLQVSQCRRCQSQKPTSQKSKAKAGRQFEQPCCKRARQHCRRRRFRLHHRHNHDRLATVGYHRHKRMATRDECQQYVGVGS